MQNSKDEFLRKINYVTILSALNSIASGSYKETDIPGLWLLHNKEYDFNLYKHTQSLVLNELSDQQFRVLKSVNFRAFDDKKEQRTVYFDAFVTKK